MIQSIKSEKLTYTPPMVESIKLDNEISLAMESLPPVPPGEVQNNTPGYFNTDPFKGNRA